MAAATTKPVAGARIGSYWRRGGQLLEFEGVHVRPTDNGPEAVYRLRDCCVKEDSEDAVELTPEEFSQLEAITPLTDEEMKADGNRHDSV